MHGYLLCRFRSSLKEGWISLAEYVAAMPEGQDAIYYLTGDDVAALKANPQIEGFTAKGIDVLLLTDTIDEFWTSMAPPYQEHRFASVAVSGGDLAKIKGKEVAETKDEPKDEAPSAEIAQLVAAMKAVYGEQVADVRVSDRLTASPVCLVAGDAGVSLHLERLLKAHNRTGAHAARVLEINPKHPVILSLAGQTTDASGMFADWGWLLLDQARIVEGEPVGDAAAFSRRLIAFMEKSLL